MNRVVARLAVSLAMLVMAAAMAGNAFAAGGNVVISQVYGGGGNNGATLKNDFIELYNRGTAAVDLSTWSVQYASSTGSGWQRTNLVGSVPAGGYYLIQEAAGTGGSVNLPTPNAIGTINMSGTVGKVALVPSQTSITTGTVCPAALLLADFVGFGTGTNCFEGTGPTATLSNTTAALRKGGGSVDTDDNAADFTVGAPNPRTGVPGDAAPSVASTDPANNASGVEPTTTLSVTFSEPVTLDASWFTIDCSTTHAHTATLVSSNGTTFVLRPDSPFAFGETCTTTITGTAVHDADAVDPPDTMTASFVWTITTSTPPVAIHTIQGSAQRSPLDGQAVSGVLGIVTAVKTTGSARGFFMQDPSPDSDPGTSEGIFVFTGSTSPAVIPGDSVRVAGRVSEFVSAGTGDLPETEIVSPTTVKISSGNPLPDPVVIGQGGLMPPTMSVLDGINFDEPLEGMLVQFNDMQAVSPTNSFGEVWIVPDYGAEAGVLTPRGGLLLQADDFNPEKFRVDDDIFGSAMARASVGARSAGPHVGVMDYAFDNYAIHLLSPVTWQTNPLQRQVTQVVGGGDRLTAATFNLENLAPANPQSKFDGLASELVDNLRSPDIVAFEEVQDNSGATDGDGVVDSTQTLEKFSAAIVAHGGPQYAFTWINPVADQDGGQPGGNIRVVFAYRTDVPGLSLAPGTAGGPTDANAVVGSGPDVSLKYNPGRIDPSSPAWQSSRKPLAAEFLYNGHAVFAIANHFASKLGDSPLWGETQPPVRGSEVQRHQQAHEVADFTAALLAANPNANVIALGDINDFQFSETIGILESGGLHDVINELPLNERYSYVFDGSSQALDHTFLAGGLFARPHVYDPVHVNAEFFDQASDHDPEVTGLVLAAPSVSAGGPYTVGEGGSVTLTATGSDQSTATPTYRWDLDGDGTYETNGATTSFSAAAIDGPATRTVGVQATAPDGAQATSTATVTITNVAPTAVLTAPAGVVAPASFTISLGSPADPSAADTAAGFSYAFDCGTGYGAFTTAASATCPTSDTGTLTVRGSIRDKDGGVTEYSARVAVTVSVDSLCGTVTGWAKNAGLANSLCVKLGHGQIGAFDNEVDAQTGKAFTAEQAATLKRLAGRL